MRQVAHTDGLTSINDPEATYVGLDVHKDSISMGVLEPGRHSAVVDTVEFRRSA